MTFPLLKSVMANTHSKRLAKAYGKGATLLLFFLMQAGLFAFSLPAPGLPDPGTSGSRLSPTADWVLYTTVKNVDFYYQINDCSGKKVVLLKFNNRNAAKVKISWKEVFTTQFEKDKDGKATRQLTLETGETSEANCANARIPELVVHASQVNPTYNVEIKSFGFKDITVSN